MGDCLRKEIVGLRKRSHAMAVKCGKNGMKLMNLYIKWRRWRRLIRKTSISPLK